MAYEVHVIHVGYSKFVKEGAEANCTCTVIKGKYNVIIDTMTPWDSEVILKAMKPTCISADLKVFRTHNYSIQTVKFLNDKTYSDKTNPALIQLWSKPGIDSGLNELNLKCDDIDYVVSTHGHSDHIGNNNLFLKATHIVGYCISHKNLYFDEPFRMGEPYIIDGEDLKIIATPGHTHSDVSVIVKTKAGTIAVTGDLFERKEDIEDENIWLYAGSENPEEQRINRKKILELADYIIPGHGDMFLVPK